MIHRQDRDGVAVLRMEHGKANAIDTDLFDALSDRLDALETSGIKGVVVTGTGGNFSAGVDLYKVLDGGADYLRDFLPALSQGVRRLFSLSKPVVAAVNGHAIAGGYILAAACDFRIMTSGKGKVGVTELLVGVPFPATAMEILRFHFTDREIQEKVYSGRLQGAAEALDAGWVDRLTDPEKVVDEAVELAARWGNVSSSAFAVTKHHLKRETLERIDRYSHVMDDEVQKVWSDPETLERIRAFMEAAVGKKGGS